MSEFVAPGVVSADVVELEKRKAFWETVGAEGRLALAYAEEGVLPDNGAWAVVRALLHASQVWRFIFNQTTYLEMRSAGDLRLIEDEGLRSELAYYYVTIAERRGAGMYQILPQYRETIRGLMPTRLSQYYWRACHEQDLVEQRTLRQIVANTGAPSKTVGAPAWVTSLDVV